MHSQQSILKGQIMIYLSTYFWCIFLVPPSSLLLDSFYRYTPHDLSFLFLATKTSMCVLFQKDVFVQNHVQFYNTIFQLFVTWFFEMLSKRKDIWDYNILHGFVIIRIFFIFYNCNLCLLDLGSTNYLWKITDFRRSRHQPPLSSLLLLKSVIFHK